jgi:DNA polymerase II small subunit/DNA polymerase delta subunit B
LDKNTGALREDKSTNISNADNVMPVADAGPDLIAREGTAVLLDGGNSFDKDGKIISYKWEQTNGPKVLLTHPDQEKASFLTPTILQDSVLGFKLTVSDNAGSDSSDRVNIMILNDTREK